MPQTAKNNDFEKYASAEWTEANIASFLNNLNKAFYRKMARSFSETRQNPWSGWYPLLDAVNSFLAPTFISSGEPLAVFDLGCGNGRFEKFLLENLCVPFSGVGVDSDEQLLHDAQKIYYSTSDKQNFNFITGDVFNFLHESLQKQTVKEKSFEKGHFPKGAERGWISDTWDNTFNIACSFGVTHHLFGKSAQESFMELMYRSLKTPGLMVTSFWQPLKLKKYRIQAKENLKIIQDEYPAFPFDCLSPNDVFLSWGDAPIFRYVHSYSDGEINELIEKLLGRHGDLRLANLYSQAGGNDNLNKYAIISMLDF